MSADDKPLLGKKILITRPSGQSDEMASMLEGLGAEVIRCPTIEFAPPDDWAPLDRAIESIETYDWIVFTSANGVRFFLHRLEEKKPLALDATRALICCAIGPATADAVNRAGLRVDVVASDSKAEGALRAIVEHLGDTSRVSGLRFLIPRAAVARDLLPDELRRLGASVDAVPAYQTIRPDVDGWEIARLFTERSVDAIAFTSSSTVANFAAVVGRKDLGELLQGVIVGCIGPVTAKTATEYGLKDVVQPRAYTSDALANSLVEELSGSGKPGGGAKAPFPTA
jgi:uroporphyrinogen III methyltransferase/synthase